MTGDDALAVVVWLQLEKDDLALVVGDGEAGGEADNNRKFSLGSFASLCQRAGKLPVSAVALEYLIADIEDLIMPVMARLPRHRLLRVSGRDLDALWTCLPVAHDGRIATGDVEQLFNDVADVASGSPVASRRIPEDAASVVALVLLREVMHHGGFDTASLSVTAV